MPSKNASRRAAKKRPRKEELKSPIVGSEIIGRVGRQINQRWPNLGGQLSSLMRVGREKLDDLYSSVARTISEHKEAFQDRLAEKKAETRAATREAKEPGARMPPSPRSKGKTAKRGTVKGPSVRPRSKRLPRSKPKSDS
jgi:hypothetical protein